MKFFIIFFLLLSVPCGYGQSVDSGLVSPEGTSSKETLILLRSQISKYVESLIMVLMDEDTPRENQMEILDEIRTIADTSGQITIALNQISQSDMGQNKIDISKNTGRDEDVSVWARNQAELIRRKELALNTLKKREKKLDEDFWVNLALDGVVIVAGGILFFIPAVGPAVSIPLTAGRITLTGQKLGALLMATGALESGLDAWNYLFGEEEERALSLVSDAVFRDVFTREMFSILSLEKESDRHVALNLIATVTDDRTLINNLLNTIQNERHSVDVRLSAIRVLRAFTQMDEDLKTEMVSVLREVIDESNIPALRRESVSVLGELGEGVEGVACYLKKIGEDETKSDKVRLIALIEIGRDKNYFSMSINALVRWLTNRYKKGLLNIRQEISGSFLDSLLSAEQGEHPEDHVFVVKEFIRLGILNAELKPRFSEALLSWDDSPENKAFLREAYSNPARDINSYVKNDLFKEGISEENYGASEFLESKVNYLVNAKNPTRALIAIELAIEDFKEIYPNQTEASEKLEEFVNSYKKILEAIKN